MFSKSVVLFAAFVTFAITSTMIVNAEYYYNANGLLVFTEDSPVNGEFDSWSSHGNNVHYKLVAHARAWQSQGLFGDLCKAARKTSCLNCTNLVFNPATVPEVWEPGMY